MQIRQAVFETNSSSSHCLVLPPISDAGKRANLSGEYFILDMHEFGWEFRKYCTPQDKASYLVQLGFCLKNGDAWHPPKDLAGRVDHGATVWLFCEDERWLQENYPHAYRIFRILNKDLQVDRFSLGINLESKGYIDHQSAVWAGDVFDLSDEELATFIANTSSYVATGNDNQDSPSNWPTKIPGRSIFGRDCMVSANEKSSENKDSATGRQDKKEPITLLFVGPVPSKKNRQRTGRYSGKRIYDPVVAEQVRALEIQVPLSVCNLNLEHPTVEWEFCSPHLRADRDGKHTTMLDVLQKTGVIKNDNMAHYNGKEIITGKHAPGQEETVIVKIYPA